MLLYFKSIPKGPTFYIIPIYATEGSDKSEFVRVTIVLFPLSVTIATPFPRGEARGLRGVVKLTDDWLFFLFGTLDKQFDFFYTY